MNFHEINEPMAHDQLTLMDVSPSKKKKKIMISHHISSQLLVESVYIIETDHQLIT